MRKSCGKVVNNLWKNCVQFITVINKSNQVIQNTVFNYIFLHKLSHIIHNLISTINLTNLTPLISNFSTFSTVPIITIKEFKIRKVN